MPDTPTLKKAKEARDYAAATIASMKRLDKTLGELPLTEAIHLKSVVSPLLKLFDTHVRGGVVTLVVAAKKSK